MIDNNPPRKNSVIPFEFDGADVRVLWREGRRPGWLDYRRNPGQRTDLLERRMRNLTAI